jgi:hypothetical protein
MQREPTRLHVRAPVAPSPVSVKLALAWMSPAPSPSTGAGPHGRTRPVGTVHQATIDLCDWLRRVLKPLRLGRQTVSVIVRG